MKAKLFALFFAVAFNFANPALAEDTRFFELRIYSAAPGKLDDLNARFRNHTTALFEKHGMENIGYWVPADNQQNKLIYILAYPSREARETSWKAFGADPEWKTVVKESEAKGKLVTKVESTFMKATDYSPAIKPAKVEPPRLFELRTYTTHEGRLPALHKRFRDHTIKLFEKHGITNFGYWTPADKRNTLIYLLAHKNQDAAKTSWAGFRADPDWEKARQASEADAGGPLTISGGVNSEFLAPTDYSPTK
ncbi:MAG: hypothetical protein QOJ40_401 [Verrucomicrobiota bacterium]